jgi:hypothetical protein
MATRCSSRRLASAAAGLAAALLLTCLLAGGCGYSASANPTITDLASTAPDAPVAPTKPLLRIGGYTAGSIHPDNVKTVYVQMWTSQEYRREVEFRLTEAVTKRILQDTPYRISSKNTADTVLYGELVTIPVTLLGSHFDSDLPKENQIVLVVNWTWKDRRTGEIIAQRRGQEQASEYIPLAGETFYDGTEIGINRLAESIVEAMQSEW